jgi:hypothetical protein
MAIFFFNIQLKDHFKICTSNEELSLTWEKIGWSGLTSRDAGMINGMAKTLNSCLVLATKRG